MSFFPILQVVFDAVLLFGLLFLFHFSVYQTQKKKEDWDILKNVEVQEIKENLQELLMTLKQLGKEVSENIQDEVRQAEEKTEIFKKNILKLQKDLTKVMKLTEEVNGEKNHLEDKLKVIGMAKKNLKADFKTKDSFFNSDAEIDVEVVEGSSKVGSQSEKLTRDQKRRRVGFSSELIRQVYGMVDSKMDVSEIVRITKLTRAEVQLILNLRGNKFTAPN